MKIRRTGVREAKARLSKLLEDARRGREWVITARGKPVAKLVPVPPQILPMDERIRRLEEAGIIEPAGHAQELPPPLPLKDGLAQTWLQEDRGE